MHIKIALIVTIFNKVSYTIDFLKSLETTPIDIKIFIIDNASTDDSKRTIQQISFKFPIRFYSFPKKVSVSETWNKGISLAINEQFDYFIIANNDIIVRKDTISNLFAEYKKGEVDLLTAKNYQGKIEKDRLFMLNPTPALTTPIDFSFIMFHKKVIEKVGLFDTNFFPAYFEDNDFTARLWLAGMNAFALTSAVMYHIGSVTQNQTHPGVCTQDQFRHNQQLFILKWGYAPVHKHLQGLKRYYQHPYNDSTISIKNISDPPPAIMKLLDI